MSSIEQYLDTVCSRIKCSEVHPDIRLELRTHLEEIMDQELATGATTQDAVKIALDSMGDPATVGDSLNKVHRPRLEWSLLALLGGFMAIAFMTMRAVQAFVPETLAGHLVYDTVACALLGGVLAIGLYFMDYRLLLKMSPWLYGLTVLTLLAAQTRPELRVLVAASPYALAVIAGVLLKKHNTSTPLDLAITAAIVGLPAMLLFSVPSFSSAIVYLTACFAMLLSLQINKKRFAIVTLTLVVMLVLLLSSTHPYASARLLYFLNPGRDANGAGWLYMRLTEAIQQAGTYGNSADTTLLFPEPQTDFVFTFIIYRYGYVAAAIVATLAALLIARLLQVCRIIREPIGRTVSIGVTVTFAFHFIGNMLMAMGKAPILSVSLPFISYSRVLLVAEIMALGLVLSIYRKKDMLSSLRN